MKIELRKEVRKMKFENIKHVTETANIEVVNKLLATGWIIINVYKPDKSTVRFVLGLTVSSRH